MDKGEFEGKISPVDSVDVNLIEDFERDSICADMNCSKSDDSNSSKTEATLLDLPEIVEVILDKMSNRELLRMRSVSKFWEAEASRELMKRPIWKDWMDIFEHLKLCRYRYGIKSRDCEDMSDTQLTELCTLLAKSDNPSLLLRNVKASSEWDHPTGIPGCENLLKDFGQFIHSLAGPINADFTSVNKFLGQDSYCPNLEVLDFCWTNLCSDSDPNFFKEIQSPPPLKLKKLKLTFKTEDEDNGDDDLSPPEHFALELVKNSPLLTHLIIGSNSSTFLKSCLQLLKTLPHVTANLAALTIIGDFHPLINELTKIAFSSNLKTVGFLNDNYNRPVTASDNKDMTHFLKRVGHSLENMMIEETIPEDSDDEDDTIHYNPKTPRDLPMMANLQCLFVSNFIIKPADGPELLEKCPSLQNLWVGLAPDENGYVDDFLERNCQVGMIHQNLQQIILGFSSSNGCLNIQSPITIRRLNQVFPKLSVAHMMLKEVPEGSSVDEVQVGLEELFLEISHMKNVKNLYIFFGPLRYCSPLRSIIIDDSIDSLGRLDLTRAFASLKEMPSLEKIRFLRRNFKYNITAEQWLMQLIDVPKLRKLKFCQCCTMGSETDKKMVELFATRNIGFKIKDY